MTKNKFQKIKSMQHVVVALQYENNLVRAF